jgi:hypothetical protein
VIPSFEFSFDFGLLMSATNEEGLGEGEGESPRFAP